MTTQIFHKVHISGWSFTAVILTEQISLYIRNERQSFEYPLDERLEIIVLKDEFHLDRLAISHPLVDEKFFLTYFNANQIADIRRHFGVAIVQAYEPTMAVQSFHECIAWQSLQKLPGNCEVGAINRSASKQACSGGPNAPMDRLLALFPGTAQFRLQ
jgi:hypothetical protein